MTNQSPIRVFITGAANGLAEVREGLADHPTLTLHLAKTDVFCQMFTGRLNLPLNLLTAQMWPRGDVRLFTRLGALFSVDARKG